MGRFLGIDHLARHTAIGKYAVQGRKESAGGVAAPASVRAFCVHGLGGGDERAAKMNACGNDCLCGLALN